MTSRIRVFSLILCSSPYCRRRRRPGAPAQHRRHHGRRCWHVEPQHLPSRHDGRTHAQHRSHRHEGAAVHRLLRPAIVHAGRAAFILGQTPFRTGLLKVGMPAAKQGLQDKDRRSPSSSNPSATQRRRSARTTSATVMSTCPRCTVSTSSTASSTTSTPWRNVPGRFPKDPKFTRMFGPRNIVDTKATTTDDPTTDPRWAGWASRRSWTAGPLPPHSEYDRNAKTTWRLSMKNSSAGLLISWTAP